MNPETMIELLQAKIQETTDQLAFAESEMRKAIIDAKAWERATNESEKERADANGELTRMKCAYDDMERARTAAEFSCASMEEELKAEVLRVEALKERIQSLLTMNETVSSKTQRSDRELKEKLVISALAGCANDCYFSAVDKREALIEKAIALADMVLEKL